MRVISVTSEALGCLRVAYHCFGGTYSMFRAENGGKVFFENVGRPGYPPTSSQEFTNPDVSDVKMSLLRG